MTHSTTTAPPRTRGFSLIEVTIALAVIATALIPLIALLPSGMSTMRKGYRAATEAEIVRLVSSELTMSDWNATNDLEDWDGTVRYYDKDGVRQDDPEFTTFTVRIEVGNGPAIPGSTDDNPYLKTVTIKVTDLPEVVADRFSNDAKHRSYANVVVKMDK
ncbi:MAG: Verru_Chthon cassette protein B [Verrucomicrobiales bacterium]